MIYLDNNATTALDPDVLEEMIPYLTQSYGNASSIQHKPGRIASAAIVKARQQIAKSLYASEKEIFFNSGATEAINTVIKGVFALYSGKGKHIITSATEHKAALACCEHLEKKGAEITYIPTDNNGMIDTSTLADLIRPDTILVALMAANNESGVIHPIEEIATITKEKNTLFFCDATQYVGKVPLNLEKTMIDILCFSAHKFHGPKGAGALYIRRKSRPTQIEALIHGGKQEQGFRGGTYNVPAIVGMGKALELAVSDLTCQQKISDLRDLLESTILTEIPDTEVIASAVSRIANTSNITFKHTKATEIMSRLPDVAISAGSACVSGDRDPSHVLIAMHRSDEEALCSLRFSLSRYTTEEEIKETAAKLRTVVRQIRDQSPVWQLYKDGLLD
ncbi:cysteine desulfurase family protein [Sphingobacterium spiritivorum]|uniref:cysteine desulfurase family protein n=1 Tax=Sphingobacterium spiritivorum TaxID=258 RepID=UPI003DA3D301